LILEWLRAGRRWDRALSTLSAAAIGLLIGLAPLLAYYWMASGNPFRPTQAMEVERFFQSSAPAPSAPALKPDKTRIGYPPPGWHGGTIEAVQGGGLRLSNLRTTLPGNIAIMRGAYGDVMLAIAIWGAVVALVRRRALFVVAVSPRRRGVGVAAPVLAVTLAGLGAWRAYASLDVRGSFQRTEMLRARTAFARVVEPGAVVITTEDIGRPAENIEYYSGVARAL